MPGSSQSANKNTISDVQRDVATTSMFYQGSFRDTTRPLSSPDSIPRHVVVTIGTVDFNGSEEYRDINKLNHLHYTHFKLTGTRTRELNIINVTSPAKHDPKPVPAISYPINVQYCTKILEVVILDEIPPIRIL
jgi:hypothetical protein